jgi:transposase-like protein
MDVHNNARLTPKGREHMVRAVVEHGLSQAEAARQFNAGPKTVAKWIARFKSEGRVGLRDRASRPISSPSQLTPVTADAVEALRRQAAQVCEPQQPCRRTDAKAGSGGRLAGTASQMLERNSEMFPRRRRS